MPHHRNVHTPSKRNSKDLILTLYSAPFHNFAQNPTTELGGFVPIVSTLTAAASLHNFAQRFGLSAVAIDHYEKAWKRVKDCDDEDDD